MADLIGTLKFYDKSRNFGSINREGQTSVNFTIDDLADGIDVAQLKGGAKVFYQNRVDTSRPKKLQQHAAFVKPV